MIISALSDLGCCCITVFIVTVLNKNSPRLLIKFFSEGFRIKNYFVYDFEIIYEKLSQNSSTDESTDYGFDFSKEKKYLSSWQKSAYH